MTTKGKKDTGKLIRAITTNVHRTDGMLDKFKKERSTFPDSADPNKGVIPESNGNGEILDKSKDGAKTVKDRSVPLVTERTDPPGKRKKMTRSGERIWDEFNKTLESEFYRDKKDVFQMSLSGECLSDYERLALGSGYKLGKKINRNDILRKVLEEFVHKNGADLMKLIDKL